jgi:hypothetical protein
MPKSKAIFQRMSNALANKRIDMQYMHLSIFQVSTTDIIKLFRCLFSKREYIFMKILLTKSIFII